MAEQKPLPPKRDVARALLVRGSVFIHLDPRVEGVVVPAWLKSQPQLVLQVGTDMPIPIPDLRIDDEGVFGTLSFQRSPFTCQVRWSAIFALVGEDGRGMVWPEDLPSEIAQEVEREVTRKSGIDASQLPEVEGGTNSEFGAKVTSLAEVRRSRPPAKPATNGSMRPSTPPRPSGPPRKGRPSELPPYLRVIK